jgi:hypothetical protein
MQNTGDGLTIHIAVDTDRNDDTLGDRLMARLLKAVHLIAESPDSDVRA